MPSRGGERMATSLDPRYFLCPLSVVELCFLITLCARHQVAVGYDAVQNLHDVVVGSPGKRGGAGAAYVFTFKAADLLQIQELTSSDALVEPAKHRFGCSLAIDQGRLVVGACEAPGIVPDGRGSFTQEPNVGAVFVFRRPLPF